MLVVNLDRFAYGRPDPQEQPAAWIADCANMGCRQEIYLGDDVIVDEYGNYYCSDLCYIRATGARCVQAGLED